MNFSVKDALEAHAWQWNTQQPEGCYVPTEYECVDLSRLDSKNQKILLSVPFIWPGWSLAYLLEVILAPFLPKKRQFVLSSLCRPLAVLPLSARTRAGRNFCQGPRDRRATGTGTCSVFRGTGSRALILGHSNSRCFAYPFMKKQWS